MQTHASKEIRVYRTRKRRSQRVRGAVRMRGDNVKQRKKALKKLNELAKKLGFE